MREHFIVSRRPHPAPAAFAFAALIEVPRSFICVPHMCLSFQHRVNGLLPHKNWGQVAQRFLCTRRLVRTLRPPLWWVAAAAGSNAGSLHRHDAPLLRVRQGCHMRRAAAALAQRRRSAAAAATYRLLRCRIVLLSIAMASSSHHIAWCRRDEVRCLQQAWGKPRAAGARAAGCQGSRKLKVHWLTGALTSQTTFSSLQRFLPAALTSTVVQGVRHAVC